MINTDAKSGKAAFALALVVIAAGFGVLAGWWFGVEALKRVLPGLVSMNPATAVAFILAGVSLAIFVRIPPGKDRWAGVLISTARWCALLTTLIGLARLAAILRGWDLGVDQWLFASKLSAKQTFPSRVAPNVALNFVLLGSALLFLDSKGRTARFGAQISTLVAAFATLLAVVGYVCGTESFYSVGSYIPMAVHTGFLFLALSVGVFLSQTDGGLLAILAGSSPGGTVARRLLPAAALVPVVLGWITLRGEEAGLYTSRVGVAGFIVGNIAVFTVLVCWSARALFRSDFRREKAEALLRESDERFSGAFEHAPIGVALVSPEGRWLKVNRALCELVGYGEAELLTLTFQDITHPADLDLDLDYVRRMLAGEIQDYQMEKRYFRAGGDLVHVLLSVSLVRDALGRPQYFISHIQDVTSREQAEKEIRFNERRYRSLVEATAAIVWNTPASGEFEVEQPGWTAFTGQSFEELRGWGWLNAIHPEDQAETGRIWAAAVASRSTYEVEHRLRARDGAYWNMAVRAVPILADNGKIQQWVGVHTDITARKREEAARLQLAAIVESSEDAIVGMDLNSLVTSWNAAAEKIFGYSSGEMAGASIQCLIPEDRRGEEDHIMAFIRRGEPVAQFETVRLTKSGRSLNVSLTVSPIKDAEGKVVGASKIARDTTARKKAEEALRLLGSALEQTGESVIITDAELDLPGPRIVFVNAAYTKMTGYSAEETMGKTPRLLQGPRTDRNVLAKLRASLERGDEFDGEAVNYRKEGQEFDVEWHITPLRSPNGKITHFVGILRDVTEHNRLQAQLFQSQKMETVGKLAGGVAHEFNSILTAIIGQGELLLGDLPPGSSLAGNASEITKAAGRAASLTRQLLAYGRKQLLLPEVLDLNEVVEGMAPVLRHLLGKSVDLRVLPTAGLHFVKADAGQLEQVVINLAVNARDVMPGGGKLTLETANVSFDEESALSYPELKVGDYVMLAITDSGPGMRAEIRDRVFEPFFTTRGVSQGSGLGLSTCLGIVKQSGGHISVYSEVGRGTTFKIYLPRVEPRAKGTTPRRQPLDLPGGTETILLVEDDPAMRVMAGSLLKRLGYTVLAAAGGEEALELHRREGAGRVDLLFTDVVMPGMSGQELSERVLALCPGTKILFTSAYTENAILHQAVLNKDAALLQKPFMPAALARKLREVLDAGDGAEGGANED